MTTQKGKENASKKPATKKAPQKSTSKACPTLGAKPLSKKTKTIVHIDEQEKGNLARDPTKFPNRFCELMFPTMVERNYHSEHLLAPPDHIAPQFTCPGGKSQFQKRLFSECSMSYRYRKKWMATKSSYVDRRNLGLIGTRSFESLPNLRIIGPKGD
ncbi:hypothetical protein AHAS_Ahas18G0209800 [Arachis hypogaea]